MDTPFKIEAAVEVSSSTVFGGSISILTYPTEELLVVPDKLDPLDMDRSVLTRTRLLSTSSIGRLSGLGLISAVLSATISSTTLIDSPADSGFLCFKAEK
jgi:hypothetical protein